MNKQPVERLKHHLRSVPDPRLQRHQLHDLQTILFIALCAVICGADGPSEIAEFGREKEQWFRRHLRMHNGVPSHDTFNRVLSLIDPQAFQIALLQWLGEFSPPQSPVADVAESLLIAIDGKSLRGSGRRSSGSLPLHLVSAFGIDQQVTLAQSAVDQKSNEIVAIPRVLEGLELRNCIVSIDAIGTQREIAQQIINQSGEYMLAVKENQPMLSDATRSLFGAIENEEILAEDANFYQRSERHKGRNESRSYHLLRVTADSAVFSRWAGARSVLQVVSLVDSHGVESSEIRYYMTSLTDVRKAARSIRSHWQIENSCHWVLDVVFAEDASRLHDRIAAENMAFLRRCALGILRKDDSKGSLKSKRKRAGWNTDFLEELLSLNI